MDIACRRKASGLLVATLLTAMLWLNAASARTEIGDLEISGEVFILSEILWRNESGPETFNLAVAPGINLGPGDLGTPSNGDKFDRLSAFRKELNLEFAYRGIPNITPVLKLRAYYDSMFDINDKSGAIETFWQTNAVDGTHNRWDPLMREAYLDLNYGAVSARFGRQIVTWGRSDGVTVLDVVTPRNFRNPLTFEQERFMIPQDMLNVKFDLSNFEWMPGGISKELQVIWNWDYTPSRFPGFRPEEEGQHPWTLNVVDFANQVIRVSEGLFGETGTFFDHDEWDKGDAWDKSEVFVRWRARTGEGLGPFSDMTYSFHYAYLFDDLPFYKLQTRFDAGFAYNIAAPRAVGGGIDFERERYHLAGFSFDKALMWLPGQFQGTVLRGEVSYNMGNRFYEPDLETVEADSLQTLIGLDQYLYIGPRSFIKTPWFVSFQYWRDEIMRDPGPGAFTNFGSPACAGQAGCGDTGYIIGGAFDAFNGLRDQRRDVITLFMFNDFLPGKTLHVELFGLHEFRERQRSTWLRAVVGYNFNRSLSGRVGINYITGKDDAFFGQFESNDSAFFEMKFTF
ncbi:MAG: DUF1302 family protein [Gammaproteobacteria bacterium]